MKTSTSDTASYQMAPFSSHYVSEWVRERVRVRVRVRVTLRVRVRVWKERGEIAWYGRSLILSCTHSSSVHWELWYERTPPNPHILHTQWCSMHCEGKTPIAGCIADLHSTMNIEKEKKKQFTRNFLCERIYSCKHFNLHTDRTVKFPERIMIFLY